MNLGACMQWDISGVEKQEAIELVMGTDLQTLPLSKGSRTTNHTVMPSVCIPSAGGSVAGQKSQWCQKLGLGQWGLGQEGPFQG